MLLSEARIPFQGALYSIGAESQKRPMAPSFAFTPYTNYISFYSLDVLDQCLRGCGVLWKCRYHGNCIQK